MKYRVIRLSIATVAAVILVLAGTSSYEQLTRLDLHSGNLRVERKLFGITVHSTRPESTPLSLADAGRPPEPDWLTVERRRAELPPYSPGDQDYTQLEQRAFKVRQMGSLGRGSAKSPIPDLAATLTLAELSGTRDIRATTKHLERVWLRLLDADVADWPEDKVGNHFRILWDKTAADPASP